MSIRITATGKDAVARRILSRKNFVAKGAQLLGAAIAVRALPWRNQVGFALPPGSTLANKSGSGLAALRAAYESKELEQLIDLMHPKMEWSGIKRLPWSRAPA
jgi:hypothetical protein